MQCEFQEGKVFLSNSGNSSHNISRVLKLVRRYELTKFLFFATFTNLSSCDFFRRHDTDNPVPEGRERGSVPTIGGIVSIRTMEISVLFIDDPTTLVTVWKGTWSVSNFPS